MPPLPPQADARTPQGDPARWKVTADVEALCWNPHDPTCFLVSCEDGVVAQYDARKGKGEPGGGWGGRRRPAAWGAQRGCTIKMDDGQMFGPEAARMHGARRAVRGPDGGPRTLQCCCPASTHMHA